MLLTDGANNTGPLPVDAAQQAADRGLRVFTIGFGTAEGGAFNGECARQFIGNEPGGGFGGGRSGAAVVEGTATTSSAAASTRRRSSEVAELTGGTYHPAESADQLKEVFAALPTNLVFRTEAARSASSSWPSALLRRRAGIAARPTLAPVALTRAARSVPAAPGPLARQSRCHVSRSSRRSRSCKVYLL